MIELALTPEQKKERLGQKQKQFMDGVRALEIELGMKLEPILRYEKNAMVALISLREMTEEEKEK